jgi:hypothetical protein
MDRPTIDVLAAHVDRLEREQALLRDRIAMLEEETQLEQERADHFYALATWAASRVGGGPFGMVERMLINRARKLWTRRRQHTAIANPVHWLNGSPDDDDPRHSA